MIIKTNKNNLFHHDPYHTIQTMLISLIILEKTHNQLMLSQTHETRVYNCSLNHIF